MGNEWNDTYDTSYRDKADLHGEIWAYTPRSYEFETTSQNMMCKGAVRNGVSRCHPLQLVVMQGGFEKEKTG